MSAHFIPFNGDIVLRHENAGMDLFIRDLPAARAADPVLDAALSALVVECQRQAGTAEGMVSVTVMASGPTLPVRASLLFTNDVSHQIRDCYALAATDATFAGVFQATMAEIARQKGLAVA